MTEIVSPLPGVFYRSPGPDKDPFLHPGDKVESGQAVGLVEVMKQFTEITSNVSGTVASIEVENAATVNPGTVLVIVDED